MQAKLFTAALLVIGGSIAWAANPNEASFLAENNTAMEKMMAGMNIKPTGNVDADFAAMMIPHHQGAIAMAQSELRYGHNQQLRQMARQIITQQQQEIVAMRQALEQPSPPPVASPNQPTSSMTMPKQH